MFFVLKEEDFINNRKQYLGTSITSYNPNFNRIQTSKPQPHNVSHNDNNFSQRILNLNYESSRLTLIRL